MDIQLYLRGIKADIGDQTEFIRNFRRTIQFSDLENPTKVTTDYSYSINLPGTDNNKSIFAYVDSLGTDLDAWNPGLPYEFILNVNGALWLHGDYQLTKVSTSKGVTTFTCSFYSMEHEMLVRLGSKTLKELSVLSENDYYYHYLDRESLADFWGGTHAFADTIRYVPTRAGFYSDFQNDKVMTGDATLAGYKAVDIGTDIDEYASREYRVEYQRPAVSVGKIMKGIAEDNGINVDASLLDSPYVKDGWMICQQFNVEESEDNILGTVNDYAVRDIRIYGGTADAGFNLPGMTQLTPVDTSVFRGTRIVPDGNCRYVTLEVAVRLSMQMSWPNPNLYMGALAMQGAQVDCSVNIAGGAFTIWPDSAPAPFKTKTSGGRTCFWVDESKDNNYVYQNLSLKDDYPGWSDCGWTPMRLTFQLTPGVHSNIQFMMNFSFTDFNEDFSNVYPASSSNIHHQADTFAIEVIPINELNSGDLSRVKAAGFSGNALTYGASSESWSPLYVNMNSILSNTEMSQRDFLMDFTKMTGCIWDYSDNYSDGSVNIVSRNRYFEGYEILDWTDKLDRSGNIEIKPITYDKLTYTLSHKDGESFLEKQFNEKTGKDYGKQYIQTGYGFNTDTEQLHESFAYNTVMSKGERTAYYLDPSGNVVRRSMTPYEIPMIEQNDHGKPKEGPRYVFDCGLTALQKAEEVCITQDSSWMRSDDIGGKCWLDIWNYSEYPEVGNNIAICSAVPVFSTHKGDAAFDWAKPMISYSGETDSTYPEEIALYPRFWSNYLEELYDAHNRILTADFALDTMDLLNFSFKNFVIIDNHLYHPNKIIDYDISGENLTRAELVEVHNLEAWVNGQNWLFENQ